MKMHKLIKKTYAKSANDAAGQVADGAPGAGTPESKRDHLAKRYRERFPSERN
jgi:hypothetical protein